MVWMCLCFSCRRKDATNFFWVGFVIASIGYLLRASAEIKMEANFTHVFRKDKDNTHELVTTGVYPFQTPFVYGLVLLLYWEGDPPFESSNVCHCNCVYVVCHVLSYCVGSWRWR